MENPNKLPEEIPTVIAREIYEESNHNYEAAKVALLLPTTPTDILVEIGEKLPFMNLQELAPLLVSHPNFSDELLERITGNLKLQWWGDDPIESRVGWETLERERAAYLKKVAEIPTVSSP